MKCSCNGCPSVNDSPVRYEIYKVQWHSHFFLGSCLLIFAWACLFAQRHRLDRLFLCWAHHLSVILSPFFSSNFFSLPSLQSCPPTLMSFQSFGSFLFQEATSEPINSHCHRLFWSHIFSVLFLFIFAGIPRVIRLSCALSLSQLIIFDR